MIFKNMMLYQLTQPAAIYFPLLIEKLSDCAFIPCAAYQAKSAGFIPPVDSALYHEQSGVIMFAAQIQEKTIPSSALRDLVDEKVVAIEAEQGRKVYRKERLTIKDDILTDKLPGVVPTNKRVYCYIDTMLNMVVIDSGSATTSETVMNLIRECIGSFPALIPQINMSPVMCMTMWVRGKSAPEGFVLGEDCELVEPGEHGGKVNCRGIDLFSDEVESHIDAGKQVHKLRLTWDEAFSAVIKDQHCIKSVRFIDRLISEAADESEDEISRFDADMALMVGTMRKFIPALGAAFGGWLEQEFMTL